MKFIIIEHAEEVFSPWLIFEYINASKLIGKDKIIYSNIDNLRVRRILRRYGIVYEKRIRNYINERNLIILDPKAKKTLSSEEAINYDGIIVGGILGDHPPRGRTSSLISNYYPLSLKRNLGTEQLTIDGAAYTAYLIATGRRVEDIKFMYRIELNIDETTIVLPYKYPFRGGEIVLSETIKKILSLRGIFDDYWTRKF